MVYLFILPLDKGPSEWYSSLIMSEFEETHDPEEGSVIRSILVEQEEKNIEGLDPLVITVSAVNNLKDRERDVVMSRFGLTSPKKVTLEEVGKKFQVTRERVRQIEASAVKKLSEKPGRELTSILKVINSHIIEAGGVISLDDLADYFRLVRDQRFELELNALRLIMMLDETLKPLEKIDTVKAGWARKDFDTSVLKPLMEEVTKILTTSGEPMEEDALINALHEDNKHPRMTRSLLLSVLRVAKNMAQTAVGKWGLTTWPSVSPKRIRDKVFLVLEKYGKPLHFNEIAELINQIFPDKKVLSRTVHNELIGDKRFVLVGRGVYALKEWGYQPGVVADVIKEVLQHAGKALTTDEIVSEVMKRRQIKRNTVIANLQNKQLFTPAGKGTYTLVG